MQNEFEQGVISVIQIKVWLDYAQSKVFLLTMYKLSSGSGTAYLSVAHECTKGF